MPRIHAIAAAFSEAEPPLIHGELVVLFIFLVLLGTAHEIPKYPGNASDYNSRKVLYWYTNAQLGEVRPPLYWPALGARGLVPGMAIKLVCPNCLPGHSLLVAGVLRVPAARLPILVSLRRRDLVVALDTGSEAGELGFLACHLVESPNREEVVPLLRHEFNHCYVLGFGFLLLNYGFWFVSGYRCVLVFAWPQGPNLSVWVDAQLAHMLLQLVCESVDYVVVDLHSQWFVSLACCLGVGV